MTLHAGSPCPAPEELELAVLARNPGEGPGDDRSHHAQRAVADHLLVCPECRERAQQVRENADFLRGLLERLGPDALREAGGVALGEHDVPGLRILREVARGGQGAVYEALQLATRRRVAVKIVDLAGAGARGRRRFEREAELAASLRHPSIVSVYERVELAGGRQALVMEFVDGAPIDRWAADLGADAPPTPQGRRDAVARKLRALAAACDAVHHAHVNGVIHRDLKPANVLVGADGAVRVVDFGVARRAAQATKLTNDGGFAGTLAYASPEQVSGKPELVDARSDIYSLGLILHEILSGAPVRDPDRPLTDVLRAILAERPPPLPGLAPGNAPAPADLQAVVAKALAKDPAQRYQSAAALRDDIRSVLDGRAVDARRASTLYVLRRLAAAHRVAVAVAVLGVALLAAFAAAMAWSSQRLAAQRSLLAAALTTSTIERGRAAGKAGESARAEELIWPELLRTGADLRSDHALFNGPTDALQALWALSELHARAPSIARLHAHPLARPMRFDAGPEGQVRLVLGLPDGSFRTIDIADGATVSQTPAVPRLEGRATRRLDERTLLVESHDAATIVPDDPHAGGPRRIDAQLLAGDRVTDAAIAARRLLTVAPDATVTLWSLDPPTRLRTLATMPFTWCQPVFSADGSTAYLGADAAALAFRAGDGAPLAAWPVPERLQRHALNGALVSIRDHSPGRVLAATFQTDVLLFDARDPHAPPVALTPAHRGITARLTFSRDGRTLASYGSEQAVKVWDVNTDPPAHDPSPHAALRAVVDLGAWPSSGPVLADDGSLLALGDDLGDIRVFGSRPGAWFTRLESPDETSVLRAAFSPDGSIVVAGSSDGFVTAHRVHDHALAWRWRADDDAGSGAVTGLAFSPDGASLAVAYNDGRIFELIPPNPTSPDHSPASRPLAQAPQFTTWVGYSPDGRHLLVLSGWAECDVFDARTGTPVARLAGHAARATDAAFSRAGPDGPALYTVGADGLCIAWDPDTWRERARSAPMGVLARAVAVSPDGRTLAVAGDDRRIRLLDARTCEPIAEIDGARQHTFGLAFHPASPEGRLLFSCGRDFDGQVWDLRTRREVAVLEGHRGIVLSLALSPDGRTLATASADGALGLRRLDAAMEPIRRNAPYWEGRGPAAPAR